MEKIMGFIMVCLFVLGAVAFSDTDSDNSESATEIVETTVFDVEASNVDPDMYEYIQKQIESGIGDNLLEVAKCETATTQQLIRVAKACAVFDKYQSSSYNKELQIDIATALSKNPKTTEDVIVELANSEYAEVNIIGSKWLVANYATLSKLHAYFDKQINTLHEDNLLWVAECELSITEQLINVAKACATFDKYEPNWYNEELQIDIATTLLENPNSTDAVAVELANSNNIQFLDLLVKSDIAKENSLVIVANKIANYNYYTSSYYNHDKRVELTNALLSNPNITDNVILELAKSPYSNIWEILIVNDKTNANALKILVPKCAEYSSTTSSTYNLEKREQMLTNIAIHPNSTDDVMLEMVNSDYYIALRLVSKSDKAEERSLKELAKKVVNYDYTNDFQTEIATNLAKHPNTTSSVMSELSNSNFQNVIDIGHHWIENN